MSWVKEKFKVEMIDYSYYVYDDNLVIWKQQLGRGYQGTQTHFLLLMRSVTFSMPPNCFLSLIFLFSLLC